MKNFKSSFISTQSSLRRVITVIDQGAAQIALVVDADQRLLGTVTDGDIRRGLLQGETLESPVERVMHREFRFVREGIEEEQEVLAMMRQEALHQIPWDQPNQDKLFGVVKEIQQVMATGGAKRNHQREGKCRNCSRRYACDERLV